MAEKIIVTNPVSEDLVVSRTQSHGYKNLVIKSGLSMGSVYEMQTEGENLCVTGVDGQASDPQYSFLCKEFGVFGKKNGVYARISVIFCDNGQMFVTLLEGSLVFNFNGELVQPIVGEVKQESVSESEIHWVDYNSLVGMLSSLNTKYVNRYYQDFEYTFNVVGQADTYSVLGNTLEYKDLSLGYTAELERQEKANELQKQFKTLTNASESDDDIDFDDDGIDDIDDDCITDSDFDW